MDVNRMVEEKERVPVVEKKRTARGLVYWQEGTTGTPVLLIMGVSMAGSAWQNQYSFLREHHQVAYFDNRGIGESDPVSASGHSMSIMAEDALSVMDALGWEDAHVVGVSMGGMVAQHLALMAPERFRSLTLIATSAGGWFAPHPRLKGIPAFLRVLRAKEPAQRAQALQGILFPQEYLDGLDASQRQALEGVYGNKTPKETIRAQIRAVTKHNVRKQIHKFSMPILIVKPDRDLLVHPKESERLHQLLPQARIVRYEKAGHGLIRQCKEELNRDLLEHFAAADNQR